MHPVHHAWRPTVDDSVPTNVTRPLENAPGWGGASGAWWCILIYPSAGCHHDITNENTSAKMIVPANQNSSVDRHVTTNMDCALALIHRKLGRDVCNLGEAGCAVRGFAAVPFQAEIHALAEGKTQMPGCAGPALPLRCSAAWQHVAEASGARLPVPPQQKDRLSRPREETRQVIRRSFERRQRRPRVRGRRQPHDLAHMEEAAPP